MCTATEGMFLFSIDITWWLCSGDCDDNGKVVFLVAVVVDLVSGEMREKNA